MIYIFLMNSCLFIVAILLINWLLGSRDDDKPDFRGKKL